MNIIIKKSYDEMSKKAAELIKEQIIKKEDSVLGLATGSTPEGLYNELIRMNRENEIDFTKVSTFNLDEYVGIAEDNESSYNYYMNNILFNHINIDKNNTHVPKSEKEDMESYCKKYDAMIEEAGGIDLQILGVGENGHIAFNEPDRELTLGTTIVELSENTIEVNSRFFDSIDDVPKSAITMGIGSIMKSKKIILLVNGARKKKVMDRFFNEDTVTTEFPISLLKLHNDLTIIMDEEARA